MRGRLVTLVVSVLVVGAACSGGSDEPQAPAATTAAPTPAPTTAPPATTTTAPPPSTTEAPPEPTTTTTSPPLPDGAELLAAMNSAMMQHPVFIGAGQGYITEGADSPTSEALISQLAVGGGPAGLDFWQLTVLDIDTPALQQTVYVQTRVVDGVTYSQNPSSGVWEIDETTDPDPVDDAFSGSLDLADVSVSRSGAGYTVTGTYAPDPMIDSVSVTVDPGSGRLRTIELLSRVPRSEFEGIVAADGDDLFFTSRIDVTAYDVAMPAVVAPPIGVSTQLVPGTDASFLTSIPSDWVPLTDQEVADTGATLGFKGPDGIVLLILVEDLSGTQITSLGGYADALVQFVFSAMDLTYFDAVKTLQGTDAWLIAGRDPVREFDFERLVYLTAEGVGVNLTFVQGLDPETGERTLAWDERRDLIDFMINSFLLNSSRR